MKSFPSFQSGMSFEASGNDDYNGWSSLVVFAGSPAPPRIVPAIALV
jgi:hypothetical protein